MAYLLFDAEDILHVVTEFVSDHVSLGEICVAAAEPLQFIPETEIDINLLVCRAIERPRLRLCGPAAGVGVAVIQNKLRAAVIAASLLGQKRLPGFLHVVERPGDQFGRTVAPWRDGSGASVGLVRRRRMRRYGAATGEIAADIVAAGNQTDDEQKDDANNSDAATAETATAGAPSI